MSPAYILRFIKYAGWLKAISSSLELLTFLQCFSLCSSDLTISIVLSSSLSNLLPAQLCLWISLVKLFQTLFCFRLQNLENWKGFIFNYACTLVWLYEYVYVSAGPVKALRHGATGRCETRGHNLDPLQSVLLAVSQSPALNFKFSLYGYFQLPRIKASWLWPCLLVLVHVFKVLHHIRAEGHYWGERRGQQRWAQVNMSTDDRNAREGYVETHYSVQK